MAYKTEIQIGVKGVAALDKLRKQITDLNKKVNGIEDAFDGGIQSVKRYSDAVKEASDNLRKVRINTEDETEAIGQYVQAVTAANAVQVRQNKLIDEELRKRGLVTEELKKYNAAAAGPRQPGSMTAQYLRPGSAVPSTEFSQPIGPEPDTAADFMQRTDAAAQAALRKASAFTVAKNEATKLAKAQEAIDTAASTERAAATARQRHSVAAAKIKELRVTKLLENEARKLGKAQLEINNAAFLARTDAAAAAAHRAAAAKLAEARATKLLANEQQKLMDKLPKGVPSTDHKKPIGPQPKGVKTGRAGALQKAGEFGLGTGFPLLFGGGAGQVIGGGLGTALAGAFGLAGQAAMGLQIGLSAIIGKVEELITRFSAVGNAINSLSMDALAGTFITVTEEARTLVRQLVEAGDAQSAVSVAANETLKQTGVLPEAVADVTNTANLLSNVWDEVVASVGGLVSLIAIPLMAALTLVLKGVAGAVKFLNLVASIAGFIHKRIVEFVVELLRIKPLLDFITNATKGVVEEEEKGLDALRKTTEELDRNFSRNKELFAIEQKRTKGKTAAEKLLNAEAKKELDLKKLSFKVEDKILELRREHGKVTTHAGRIELGYAELVIRNNAKIEESRINQTHELKAQSIELDRQKEIEKVAKEELKAKVEQHKIAQGVIQAQTVALEGQIEIFNLQAQAAQSVLAVTQARKNAELSALKLEESRLQRQLSNLQRIDKAYDKQRNIIDKIAQNRKKQAQVEFEIAKQSIKQMVHRAELEHHSVKSQVQKINLQIQLLRLQAEEIEDTQKKLENLAKINQQAKISADIAKQMLMTADRSLDAAREIAKFQGISAQHVLDGKLASIEAERVDGRRAVHAASIAKSEKAAQAAKAADSGPSSGLGSATRYGGFGSMPRYGDGGHVSGAQLAMIGEKGPEYVVPERKAAAFATNYLMGARGAGAIPRYAEGGYTGSINIQTGPVMQQDNETYLTMGQFEEGMRELTESLARGGRSYGSRQFQGVS